jgi:tetratricopeptide (TPR) repeat protein
MSGDVRGAIEWEEKALALAPDDALIHWHLAGFYRKLGEYEEAIAAYTKSIALANKSRSDEADDKASYRYGDRGGAYAALKMYKQALADYDKAVELAPFRSFTYKRRAVVHFQLGNYDRALADIAKAVELKPDDVSNVTWITERADVVNCPDESFRKGILELADKVVVLNQGADHAHVRRIEVHAALGREEEALSDLDAAIADFSEAIRVDPIRSDVYKHRAAAYSKKGDTEKAVADYREAIRIDPQDALSLAELADLLANREDERRREYDRAIELAKQAVALSPQRAYYRRVLGSAEYRAGDWEAARDTLEYSLKLKTLARGEERWIFLAMTYWQLGNKAEAQTWYRRFAEHVKTNRPDREDLLRLLAEAEELMGPIDVDAAEKKPQDEPGQDAE